MWMNSDVNTSASQAEQFASREWREEIIGVPAMFMAFGIFLRYPAPYLLERMVGSESSDRIVTVLGVLLLLFALFVVLRFLSQAKRDRRVLWDYSPNHFRMGTWVAGFAVLATLFHAQSLLLAQALFVVSVILWMLYLSWLTVMAFREKLQGGKLNGTVFLSTVATQSIVIAFMVIFPGHVADFLPWLIILNVFGIALYWISFSLVWVAGGFRRPFRQWVPQNNITHGALSITMLSAQMIEESIPGSLPYFHLVIQVAWVATALMVVGSHVYEVWLVIGRKVPLLNFHLGNYARNFTYGMFFACTYFGYMYPHPSIMKLVLDPGLLAILGTVVLAVNVWELGHQLLGVKFRRVWVRLPETL